MITVAGQLINFDHPKVMGILNVTKYSFFDGGKYYQTDKDIIQRAEDIVTQGADIIDIGCMATNPKAVEISQEEEMQTMTRVVTLVKKQFPDAILSIDTYRSNIAARAIDLGAHIINDISAGDFDSQMFDTIAKYKVPYIIMHTPGKPDVMQSLTSYNDVVSEVIFYLSKKVNRLHLMGLSDIIVDPGFGFGKTVCQNFEMLKHLAQFKELGCPILAGVSRKSMLYKLLNTTPEESLTATIVANTIALLNGADILRVHDVRQAVEAIKIVEQIL